MKPPERVRFHKVVGFPPAIRWKAAANRGPVSGVKVSELAGGDLPPLDDPAVKRQLERIRAGRKLRPITATRRAGRVHILDGHHRVSAIRSLDPDGKVRAVFIDEGKETSMGKGKNKIGRSSVAAEPPQPELDAAQTAALSRIAEQIDRLGDHPSILGLAEKARGLAMTPPNPDVSRSPRNPPSLAKADEVAESLAELAQLRKTDLAPHVRARVEKAYQDLSTEYRHQASPSAAIEEDRRQREADQRAARVTSSRFDARREAPVIGEDLAAKAARLQKADPTLTPYDAMLKAAGDTDGRRAYLDQLPGH